MPNGLYNIYGYKSIISKIYFKIFLKLVNGDIIGDSKYFDYCTYDIL